jgi:hypothetical protein
MLANFCFTMHKSKIKMTGLFYGYFWIKIWLNGKIWLFLDKNMGK